jgi:hypothetical protein
MISWVEAQEYLGKYKGRRTAYVVDVNLGGQLIVYIPMDLRHETMDVSKFLEMVDKYKMKRRGYENIKAIT